MFTATITQAKNQLSALIDRVRTGESVLIVDRGIPVARLESAIGTSDDADGKVARLERAGLAQAGRGQLPREILTTPPPRPRKGADAVRVLLDERRTGR